MKSKKSIEKLYYMFSNEIYQADEEILKIAKEISDDTDKLKSTLTPEQIKLLKKIEENQNEKGDITDKNIFVFAFSLAKTLFSEGLKESKEK